MPRHQVKPRPTGKLPDSAASKLPPARTTSVGATLVLMLSTTDADVGDTVIIRGHLTDEDGDPIEGAKLEARAAHSIDVTKQLGEATDEGDGVYSAALTPDTHGRWRVRMEASDPAVAKEATMHVRRSPFVG